MIIALIIISTLLINIPFGYWRKQLRKLSVKWFFAIHIPVVISIGIKFLAGIDFQLLIFILSVAAFITGQATGQKLYVYMKARKTQVDI